MPGDWRFFAERVDGRGAPTLLEGDLPLSDVTVTTALSGPGGLTATVAPEIARLQAGDGARILEPWATQVWAEVDGQVVGGGLLVTPGFSESKLSLDCVGLGGYPKGMPYDGDRSWVDVDPLDIVRHVWEHLQSQPGGQLGVVVDMTTSPVRIGEPETTASFTTDAGVDVSFQAGPFRLNWWTHDDLGQVLDTLARDTPFDSVLTHAWSGDTLTHRLQLGQPSLGRRRDDLRFVLGENLQVVPEVTSDGDGFANAVRTLGSGEGRDMVRADAAVLDGRVRRVVTVAEKSARSPAAAAARARRELAVRQGLRDVSTVVVREHANAPLGSWALGDEINIQAETGWAEVDLWVRVVAQAVSPDSGDTATLTVLRSDREAA